MNNWEKLISQDNREADRIEKQLKKVERAQDRRDRKQELKELKRWEKMADKDLLGG